MERVFTIRKKDFLIGAVAVFFVLGLAFGFGYFFGRYDQILINKSLLHKIPNVNCE